MTRPPLEVRKIRSARPSGISLGRLGSTIQNRILVLVGFARSYPIAHGQNTDANPNGGRFTRTNGIERRIAKTMLRKELIPRFKGPTTLHLRQF